MQMSDFLTTFASQLEKRVDDILRPLYKMQDEEDNFGSLVKPFAVQRELVKGISKAFTSGIRAVFAVGEMGVGKSLIGIWAAQALKAKRTLIISPPHLVNKWKKEVLKAYPTKRIAVIPDQSLRKLGVSNFAVLQEIKRRRNYDFVVISREAIKTDFPTKRSTIYREKRGGYCCPQCFGEIDLETLLKADKIKAFCEKCGSALFSYTRDGNRGRPSLAKFIQKKMKSYFDFIIVDEVHEYKGEGTAQGAVLGKLAGKARTLALTGTLMGGLSSNLFTLVWRMAPNQMKKEGFNHNSTSDFIRKYGVLERTVESDEADNKYSIGRKRRKESERERPGLSPLFVGSLLLDKAVFLRLSDFAEQLPLFNEHPVACAMHPKVEDGYNELLKYQDAFRSAHNPMKVVSSAIRALLAYPDTHTAEEICDEDEEGNLVPLLNAPEVDIPLGETEKEIELVRIVKEAKAAGKKVLIFTTQSDKRDIQPRLHKLMEMHGLRSSIMTRAVGTAKRDEWIERMTPKVDELVMNPRLVMTGFDLLDYPVIVWFDMGWSTFVLRQASRRSYRIVQKEPAIDVYYLYTAGSVQQDCLSLMATKTEVSLMCEGEISESGLSAMSSGGGSVLGDLAKVISGKLKTENPLEVFSRINKKNNEGKKQPAKDPQAPEPALVMPPSSDQPGIAGKGQVVIEPLSTFVNMKTGQVVIQF